MFRKNILTIVAVIVLSITPNKAQAAVSLGEIVENIQRVKDIYDFGALIVVGCFKFTRKVCKTAYGVFKRRPHNNADTADEEPAVYINPIRAAAEKKEDEVSLEIFNTVLRVRTILEEDLHIHPTH